MDASRNESIRNGRNPDQTKLLICIDSNRKFIDHRKFWNLEGTTWKACGTIETVNKIFDSQKFEVLDTVILSCGVNDIDSKSGNFVAGELLATTNRIRREYPNVKIIINEVTPRNDDRDGEVKKCNEAIHSKTRNLDYVFITQQSHLRNNSWSRFYDEKHIKRTCIPIYVASLKKGLRWAYSLRSNDVTNGNGKISLARNLRNTAGYETDRSVDYDKFKESLIIKIADTIRQL